jgi:hypothetical protein
MKKAHNPFISEYLFRIDGATLVPKSRHQHEKAPSSNGSHFGELCRSGDHARPAQAGMDFSERGLAHHGLVQGKGLAGDPQPGGQGLSGRGRRGGLAGWTQAAPFADQ